MQSSSFSLKLLLSRRHVIPCREMLVPEDNPLTVGAVQDLLAFLQLDKGLGRNLDVAPVADTLGDGNDDRIVQFSPDEGISGQDRRRNEFSRNLFAFAELFKLVLDGLQFAVERCLLGRNVGFQGADFLLQIGKFVSQLLKIFKESGPFFFTKAVVFFQGTISRIMA